MSEFSELVERLKEPFVETSPNYAYELSSKLIALASDPTEERIAYYWRARINTAISLQEIKRLDDKVEEICFFLELKVADSAGFYARFIPSKMLRDFELKDVDKEKADIIRSYIREMTGYVADARMLLEEALDAYWHLDEIGHFESEAVIRQTRMITHGALARLHYGLGDFVSARAECIEAESLIYAEDEVDPIGMYFENLVDNVLFLCGLSMQKLFDRRVQSYMETALEYANRFGLAEYVPHIETAIDQLKIERKAMLQ